MSYGDILHFTQKQNQILHRSINFIMKQLYINKLLQTGGFLETLQGYYYNNTPGLLPINTILF